MKIIRNAEIFDGYQQYCADICIEGTKIKAVGTGIECGGAEEIDASGKYVFPAGIDPHVHFELPMGTFTSVDTFETGTRAAAAGGITTIIDFSSQQKGEGLYESFKTRREQAEGNVCVDYSLHCGIVDPLCNETLADMIRVSKDGGKSFKIFTAYRSRGMMSDDVGIMRVLSQAREIGAVVGIHAENDAMVEYYTELLSQSEDGRANPYNLFLSRPQIVEDEAVNRCAFLARKEKSWMYIVHLSSGGALDIICEAKSKGAPVAAETCPQYLCFTSDMLKTKNGHYFGCCPPIKENQDVERLWAGLKCDEIEFIGTDTCSFTCDMKNSWGNDFRKIPYGLPGVELMLPVLYSEGVKRRRITMNQFVRLVSVNAAKFFGMFPEKGSLLPGTDADIVIWDPASEWTVDHTKLHGGSDWSPYDGMQMHGHADTVFCRGKIAAQNRKFTGEKGWGTFIRR